MRKSIFAVALSAALAWMIFSPMAAQAQVYWSGSPVYYTSGYYPYAYGYNYSYPYYGGITTPYYSSGYYPYYSGYYSSPNSTWNSAYYWSTPYSNRYWGWRWNRWY